MKVAPEQRLGQQEDVAPRQKHRFFRRADERRVFARDAPVRTIHIGDWLFEHNQGLQRRGSSMRSRKRS